MQQPLVDNDDNDNDTSGTIPAGHEEPEQERPIVGVIRWDAFYGTSGVPRATEKALSPARYHWRAPFFAQKMGPDLLSINGDSDDIFEKEIDYAIQAGIYWAFMTYPYQSDMSIPLRRFLVHPRRHQVNFTLILSQHSLNGKDWEKHFQQVLLDAVSMSNYQTVLGGRPLVYFYFPGDENHKAPSAERLAQIRAMIQKQTNRNPYLVLVMHGIPREDWHKYHEIGYDGSTKYFQPFIRSNKPLTYEQFVHNIQKYDWDLWAQKDGNYHHSPVLSAGWDNRPRYYNPPPWMKHTGEKMLRYYVTSPTSTELAQHVKAGMDFVYQQKDVFEAQNLLMYAWNEHDEGGWLCPTFVDNNDDDDDGTAAGIDDSRVKAVGEVIHNWVPPTTPNDTCTATK